MELKNQQEVEVKKMYKYKKWVEQKKNTIAEISSKIVEEENKQQRIYT